MKKDTYPKDIKAIFTYADYYDSTTATRRVLLATKSLFSKIRIAYWARQGYTRDVKGEIYEGVNKIAFTRNAPPRSLKVLILFVRYQFWIFKNLLSYKPDFIHAFYFYTIAPCLVYKYLLNRKCIVLYDPRDYVAVCYRVPKFVSWSIRWIDSLFAKLADFTIFPDKQYFNYYGKIKLKAEKYFIIPNSLEDSYEKIKDEDSYLKFKISRDKLIIPIIGYFSETRGRSLFYEIIRLQPDGFQFVIAGDFRSQTDIDFFTAQNNVTFLGNVPYLEALTIMKDSAIVPLLYDPVLLNNKYAFPTKYYDALMVGSPVLVSDGQVDVYEDMTKHNVGFGIKYNDVKGFLEILQGLKTKSLTVNKQAIREYYLSKYDYNLYKNTLREKYLSLLSRA